MSQLNVKISKTTTYHPESNPVERANREIGRIIRVYCHQKHTTWVKWLPKVEYWINHITHEATGYTPHEIMTGKKPNITLNKLIPFPSEDLPENTNVIIQLAKRRLQKAAKNRTAVKDRQKRFPTYVAGQQVLV